MKCYENVNIWPELGTTRRRSGFLFLPKTHQGVTRWMEWAEWEDIYASCPSYMDRDYCQWVFNRWTDITQEEIDKRKKVVHRRGY